MKVFPSMSAKKIPQLKQLMIEWQLENPDANARDCERWLQANVNPDAI
jgi:hypothetical protein